MRRSKMASISITHNILVLFDKHWQSFGDEANPTRDHNIFISFTSLYKLRLCTNIIRNDLCAVLSVQINSHQWDATSIFAKEDLSHQTKYSIFGNFCLNGLLSIYKDAIIKLHRWNKVSFWYQKSAHNSPTKNSIRIKGFCLPRMNGINTLSTTNKLKQTKSITKTNLFFDEQNINK